MKLLNRTLPSATGIGWTGSWTGWWSCCLSLMRFAPAWTSSLSCAWAWDISGSRATLKVSCLRLQLSPIWCCMGQGSHVAMDTCLLVKPSLISLICCCCSSWRTNFNNSIQFIYVAPTSHLKAFSNNLNSIIHTFQWSYERVQQTQFIIPSSLKSLYLKETQRQHSLLLD